MKKIQYVLSILLISCICTFQTLQAQGKFIDKKGKIAFEASEELFEPVKASNESVTAILNTKTNEIASLALMKSFRFKNSLMEEHFNENYVESETYPKAIFKGKLVDFNFSNITENKTEVTIDGTIEMHGKEKKINAPFNISKVGDIIMISGSFSVTPSDFDIDIPSVVKNKIAKNIIVTIDFNLAAK